MKSYSVMLSSIIDVKNFVNIANEFEFDMDLVSARYVVDAKSLMGIFSLDLANPLIMRVYTEDEEEIKKIEKDLKEFIVE